MDELEIPQDLRRPIKHIFVFGSWMIASTSHQIIVWKTTSWAHYTTITPLTPRTNRRDPLSGVMCSMPTFLNKVFVGRADGVVDVWNISTGRLVYTIQAPFLGSGAVTALQPSPTLSVLAVGREDGSICLHDVRKDRLILNMNARSAQQRAVTSISFRTDAMGAGRDGAEDGIMAATSKGTGDVTFWDLTKGGRISGILHGAHSTKSAATQNLPGGVGKIEFLPGQDVLISSGSDNSLKSWIFDAAAFSPVPRILHQRSGHAAPLTKLFFVPSNSDDSDTQGKWLLSAAKDRALWGWSLRKDGQSTELSQGNVQKKAKKLGINGRTMETSEGFTTEDLKVPDITGIACSLNRDGGMGTKFASNAIWTNMDGTKKGESTVESFTNGWESIVTSHRGDKHARTWFWGKKKAGRWRLASGDGAEVTSIAITSCGTFALVGSVGGSIAMYNLQSGIQRQKFPSVLTPAQARRLKKQQPSADITTDDQDARPRYGLGEGKHRKAVTGLMVDALNRTVISCGLDGKIKFWSFLLGQAVHEIDWSSMTAIIGSQYHQPNDLVALSCDDLSIRIVDTQTRRTVRELWGCQGQISDFCFSNDGRWIIASSMDSIIRVWDLPTGHLISALGVESPCVALAFSDTGEFLATAHADQVGISLWNNRALFTHVPVRPLLAEQTSQAQLPASSGEGGRGMIAAAFDETSEEEDVEATLVGRNDDSDVLDDAMQSLSLVPRSRWQTLLHLDTIRERNKPIEPPKKPEKAPFFLPSLENGKPQSSSLGLATQEESSKKITTPERTRISKLSQISTASAFGRSLHSSDTTMDFSVPLQHLSSLSPSAADIEVRSLSPSEFVPFVRALIFGLRRRQGYELVQTWMAVFLRIHGDMIASGEDLELVEVLGQWRVEQDKEGKRLNDLVGFCGGVMGFLRSVR